MLSTRLRAAAAAPAAALLGLTAALLAAGPAEPVSTSRATALAPAAATVARGYGIWRPGEEPGHRSARRKVTTVGTQFRVTRAGRIVALRFYKFASTRGPFVGRLYTAHGRLLASARFPAGADVGWRRVTLPRPVRVRKGHSYVVAYVAPHGRFAADRGMFAPGQVVTHRALTAVNSRYANSRSFPRRTHATGHYADVVFRASTSGSTSAFPDAANTGVPPGTELTPYSGPCTVRTAGTVIDAKAIDCDPLLIRTTGVQITRSRITGTVRTEEDSDSSFTIRDSEVDAGDQANTGIGAVHFIAVRVEVRGGNRSIYCYHDCTVRDSYVHGQFTDDSGAAHESGIRMSQHTTLRHNTILCDAPDVPPDAGCSADLTGYGDFEPVRYNVIANNLFKASTGGTCAYGGSSGGKPYSGGAHHISFTDNVFERGPGGNCGYWAPVMDFRTSAPGNTWTGNTWDDGTPVEP